MNKVSHFRWLAVIVLAIMLALALISLPRWVSTVLFICLSLAAVWYLLVGKRQPQAGARLLIQLLFHPTIPPAQPEKQRIPRPVLLVEILLIVCAALWASRPFANLDKTERLPGGEAEWLTSSAYFSALNLREYGYIPLWQPWLETGEPLVDNPFAFVFNPISTLPALLWGGVNGIKISVVLYALLAGVGGWFLGHILGLGSLGRVLLGLLVLGKGNMHAMIGTGYFQLGVSQAYFPWIVGGVLAICHQPGQRWPVVLTAVMGALLFWAGNIWYTLPMLVVVALLISPHIISRRGVNWFALRRLEWAALLMLGLCAITLLPLWVQRDYIGGHAGDPTGGRVSDITRVIEQYFNGDFSLYQRHLAPGNWEFYYSYIIPFWFLMLMAALLPFGWSSRANWRIWMVGSVSILFFTLWGSGGYPSIVWLYQHVPLLDQWRFVGRALAVASFWIGVLVVLRVDMLWQALKRQNARVPRAAHSMIYVAMGVLALSGGAAAWQVVTQWHIMAQPEEHNARYDAYVTNTCIAWLREHHPGEELTVFRWDYNTVYVFLDQRVRLSNISADYYPISQKSTLTRFDLTQMTAEYGIATNAQDREWFTSRDYEAVEGTPIANCLYRNPVETLDYAFTIPLSLLRNTDESLLLSITTPIFSYTRYPDTIKLEVPNAGFETVVVIQERAYPGWKVKVDGRPAKLESVGGLTGVVLSPGSHHVQFLYRPPLFYWGTGITLITIASCLFYLLRGDKIFLRLRRRSIEITE